MNSIATAYVADVHHRLRSHLNDSECLRVARLVTVLVGLAGTVSALVLASTDIRSVYTTVLELMGVLGGTLAGCFAFGSFSWQATGGGAWLGATVSAITVFLMRSIQPLSVYAYASIGIIVCVGVGWMSSFNFAVPRKELHGLKIYST